MEGRNWIATGLDGQDVLLDLRRGQTWTLVELETFPSGRIGPDSYLHRAEDRRWFVRVGGLCYEKPAWDIARNMGGDGLWEIPAELRSDLTSGRSEGLNSPGLPPIRLAEGGLLIVSQHVEIPNPTWREVLIPVIRAFPGGLTDEELYAKSGYRGAVILFKRMRERVPELGLVLVAPGRRGHGGYRCRYPDPWRG